MAEQQSTPVLDRHNTEHATPNTTDEHSPTKSWLRLLPLFPENGRAYASVDCNNTTSINVGRDPECDFVIDAKQIVVSTRHCTIFRNSDGKTFVRDESTNGTFINGRRIPKHQEMELNQGDELFLTRRRLPADRKVGFVVHLQHQSDQTNSPSATAASPISTRVLDDGDDQVAHGCDERRKLFKDTQQATLQGAEDAEDASTSPPNNDSSRRSGTTTNSKTKRKPDASDGDTGNDGAESDASDSSKRQKKDPSESKSDVDESHDMEESMTCCICREIFHDCVTAIPCLHSFCAGCLSEWTARSSDCPQCRIKVTHVKRNHTLRSLVETFLKAHPNKRRSKEDLDELDKHNIFTRETLETVSRRRAHDDDYDDEEEYSGSDASDVSDDEDDEEAFALGAISRRVPFRALSRCIACANPRACPDGYTCPANAVHVSCSCCGRFMPLREPAASRASGRLGPFGSPVSPSPFVAPGPVLLHHPARGDWPDLPDNLEDAFPTGTFDSLAAGPPAPSAPTSPLTRPLTAAFASLTSAAVSVLTSSATSTAAPPPTAPATPAANVPQQCALCSRYFCCRTFVDGCPSPGCNARGGCLFRIWDPVFVDSDYNNAVNRNVHESLILKKYLDSKHLSFRDMFRQSLVLLKMGYFRSAVVTDVRPADYCCRACSAKLLHEFAYQYLASIDMAELPAEARTQPSGAPRTDCWYGNQCRTQWSRPHHARNFNHVCEATH